MTIRSVSTVLIVALCIVAGQRGVSTQTASDPYFIADLGTLGGAESRALGLSPRGPETVGSASRQDGSVHAFVFVNTMTDLGTLGGASSAATDVSRIGTIVGRAQIAGGNNRAFAYTPATGMQSLGTLGGSQSEAVGINDAGDIFGSSDTAGNAARRAFIYRNGTMSVLGGTFGGTNSAATAANEGQEVVGWASTAGNATVHAFLYSGGTMTDLGTLGTSSEALAVNDAAEVAGRSTLASGARHAFLYSGGVMVDLGTLGGTNSEATGINYIGSTQVVGTSDVPGGGTHAFLYDQGTMTDLNSRLPAGSGWVLEAATAINDAGEIVGWGRHNGLRHAYRLLPSVRLSLRSGGTLSQRDGNLPTTGVQVGRDVTFVTSVEVASDGTARNIVFTDTMSGPIQIQGVRLYHDDGGTCSVEANIVTCHIASVGMSGSFAEEVWVTVRVTAPGVFSHTAHATAANSIPNSADTVRQDNIGIALASLHAVGVLGRGRDRRVRERDADVPATVRRRGHQGRQQQPRGRSCSLAAGRSAADRDPLVQHRARGCLATNERGDFRNLRTRHDLTDADGPAAKAQRPGPDTQHDDWVLPDGHRESHADRSRAVGRSGRLARGNRRRREQPDERHGSGRHVQPQLHRQLARGVDDQRRHVHGVVRWHVENTQPQCSADLRPEPRAHAIVGGRRQPGQRCGHDRMRGPVRRHDRRAVEHEHDRSRRRRRRRFWSRQARQRERSRYERRGRPPRRL